MAREGRAAGQEHSRRNRGGFQGALPPDHDDVVHFHPRRYAARARERRGRERAPLARHRSRKRDARLHLPGSLVRARVLRRPAKIRGAESGEERMSSAMLRQSRSTMPKIAPFEDIRASLRDAGCFWRFQTRAEARALFASISLGGSGSGDESRRCIVAMKTFARCSGVAASGFAFAVSTRSARSIAAIAARIARVSGRRT